MHIGLTLKKSENTNASEIPNKSGNYGSEMAKHTWDIISTLLGLNMIGYHMAVVETTIKEYHS
ncbi:hypothetical protein KY284_032464 [Solanum tuberosum]|nr:hypothetical protein KY284_032464 [Solanum tuberosum]